MSKPNSFSKSDLNASNRKMLSIARKAGLSSDEIIRKSLEAAYGNLLRGGNAGKQSQKAVNHKHNHKSVKKTLGSKLILPSRKRIDGENGRMRI